ncbi:MAG: hypothetical protein R3300_15165 [Candidatus Promineifilaceae bacterium]|nr:hypothetical protein [Candidatus Promineifilaceae bacterium]
MFSTVLGIPLSAVRALTRPFVPPLRRFWAFIGRLGLALRHLLTLFIWRPSHWSWRFLGRLGLAWRHLLTVFVWRPARWLVRLTSAFYRRVLRRPWRFVRLSLSTFVAWLVAEVLLAAPGWLAGLTRRTLRWLAGHLRPYWQALGQAVRLRLWNWLGRPLPAELEAATPATPRLSPVATAVVTTSLLLLASYLTTQVRHADEPAVYGNLPSAPIVKASPPPTSTPTPLPTATVPPTPTATAAPVQAALPAAQDWPTPDPLSAAGSVIFTLHQRGNSDLYALSVGRSEAIRLTNHPAPDRDPAWSPDGRYVAFASRRDGYWNLYTLDLASADVTQVTSDPAFDAAPHWSPDGRWLVFESYRQNNLDVYITRADGSGAPIRVTEDPAADFSPVWSPGGRHLAFTSRRSGNNDIYILSLDASSDADAINATMSPDRQEDHPAFGPDGRFLAYDDRAAAFDLVYSLPLDNYWPSGAAVGLGQGRYPAWSPDGQALAYVYRDTAQSYIIASGTAAWNVAPQAFSASGRIDNLAWSGIALPPAFERRFADRAAPDPPLFVESVAAPSSAGADASQAATAPGRLAAVADPATVEDSEASAGTLLYRLDVNAPSPYLSDRVDQSFTALRQRVQQEAGWDFLGTLEDMYSSLARQPLPGQSHRDWNKAGRAFDIYYRHAMAADPQVEVVREDRGPETYWRVYLKAARQDGSQGEPLSQAPWDFNARYGADPQYYDHGGMAKERLPAGYYVDFTALAADYGWQRVPAQSNWRTFFQGIQFWRFENRQGLNWEGAMADIYTPAEMEAAFGPDALSAP